MASAPSGAERKEETMETWREKFRRFLASLGLATEPGVHYIGGSDVLPPPLKGAEELQTLQALEQGDEDARQRLVEHHRLSAGKLNAEKVKYVSARAQFREEQLLEPLFTEDELAMFKRGRNASKASVSKHASPEEYRASTGFECLLGWLYLNGQLDRVHELFDTLWQQFDPNETR